jgi:hypothetical protein
MDLRCFRKILPGAAQHLAAQLRGEQTPPIPAPGITAETWNELLRLVCTGSNELRPHRAALRRVGISQGVLRAYLRAEPHLRRLWAEAVRWGRRKAYSRFGIEEVLDSIGTTSMSAKAACELHSVPYKGFLELTTSDSALGARYLAAKENQQDMLHAVLAGESWSQIDDVPTRQVLRERARAFNQGSLAIRRLQPQRIRRAEAKIYRAEYQAARAAADPGAARLQENRRRAAKSKPV